MIRNILVPVDFSEDSEAACRMAQALARSLEGAELHLLHVIPDQAFASPPYGPRPPADFSAEVERAADTHFREWRAQHFENEEGIEHLLRRGDPSSVIVETAKAIGADLIVMGTRGLTGLQRLLIGSVTERTVRSAPCPVMSVRSEA